MKTIVTKCRLYNLTRFTEIEARSGYNYFTTGKLKPPCGIDVWSNIFVISLNYI